MSAEVEPRAFDDTRPEHHHFTLQPLDGLDSRTLRNALLRVDGVTIAEVLTDGEVDVFTYRPEWFVQEARRISEEMYYRTPQRNP